MLCSGTGGPLASRQAIMHALVHRAGIAFLIRWRQQLPTAHALVYQSWWW